jgi:diacylglycerol kinase (ATP)
MATSPFGTIVAIVDPRAGGGRASRELPALRRALNAIGLEHRIEVAEGHGVERAASAAAEDGARFLVAVGDDRTVQGVVNGLFRDGRTIVELPVLGVVGAGTQGDLLRSFGLPDDVDRAVGHLVGDNVYPFDVIKVVSERADGAHELRYAHNVAEVGLHAAAWRRTSGHRGSGNLRRFAAFWSAYATERVRDVHLQVDAREDDLRTWSVVVGNGQFADGGLRLSPRSFPGDGTLDVLVFTGPKSDAYRLLPRIFRHGDHVPDEHVLERRAKLRVRVDAARPMPVVADGVAFGTTPVTFQVVPQQILIKL